MVVYTSKELARNQGRAARAIEVAVEHDIGGSDLADIAGRSDSAITSYQCRAAPTRSAATRAAGGDTSSTGRELLAALGVWPWAHVESWSRQRRWWREEDVLRALVVWHDRAWMRALQRLAYSGRGRYGNSKSGGNEGS
ncbi:MAG: hypothetical protein ACYCPS_04865 [Candidatus Saccharimonadales bacterium]